MNDTLYIKTETDNLALRTLKVEDVTQAYVDWLNEPEINKYLDVDSGQTVQSCVSYVQSFEGRKDAAIIGIFHKKDKLHIGNMTLSSIDWRNKWAWVGITLGRNEYRGCGLAKEALIGLVRYCFKELKLHRVQTGVSVENKISVNLVLNCGFNFEGCLRESGFINGRFEDSYIFSVLEREVS